MSEKHRENEIMWRDSEMWGVGRVEREEGGMRGTMRRDSETWRVERAGGEYLESRHRGLVGGREL